MLQDYKAPTKLKICLLWASLMFCYVYGDFFGLFSPGKLMKMNAGLMGPLGEATPAVLLGVSAMMAIPATMVFLSLILPPSLCRWLNILLGVAYSAIMLMTMTGAPPFYLFFGTIEIALTLTIIYQASTWPKIKAGEN